MPTEKRASDRYNTGDASNRYHTEPKTTSTFRPYTDAIGTGCYIDSHAGHYGTRDVLYLARDFGFILSAFETFVLEMYDSHYCVDIFPNEELFDLCDEAISWLNCDEAPKGQNLPPIKPVDYSWSWNDGDFGLYPNEED
jgi:hypothetical protein